MTDFNGAKHREDDLTWLARNVHEWPIFAKYISKRYDSYSWTAGFLSEHGAEWHSKEDWLARRAELQAKLEPSSDDWYKRGEFPPVGTECEALTESGWNKAYVVGFDSNGYMVCHFNGGCHFGYRSYDTAAAFRPLQTERERVASELVDVMLAVPVSDRKTASESYMSMALAIYDHLHPESRV